LDPAKNSLFGFGGKKIDAFGKKSILVSFVEGEKVRTETIAFGIVYIHYPYTSIFGRGILSKFDMAIKQSYLCMKMPSPFSIITIHGDQAASRRIEDKPMPGYNLINEVTIKSSNEEAEGESTNKENKAETRVQPIEDTVKTPLSHMVLEKCVHIGSSLTEAERHDLITFLYENRDVFAWSARDLQGVSRDLAQHNLNITKGAKKQKLRKMLAERAEAAKAEVQRLLDARVIRLVQ
jgi:hypothetical protein